MANPIKITGTIDAWLTSTSDTLDKVFSEKNAQDQLTRLGYSNYDMSTGSYPWVKIGAAEITVTLLPRDEIVAEQVKTLQTELQKERAESQMKQNAILDRIGKLQALTFDGAESTP